VVETQGQLRKEIRGTRQTDDQVRQTNAALSRQRSAEVTAAVPTGANQWSSYPQSDLPSPKQVQGGR
jgi:Mn-containing catalase